MTIIISGMLILITLVLVGLVVAVIFKLVASALSFIFGADQVVESESSEKLDKDVGGDAAEVRSADFTCCAITPHKLCEEKSMKKAEERINNLQTALDNILTIINKDLRKVKRDNSDVVFEIYDIAFNSRYH